MKTRRRPEQAPVNGALLTVNDVARFLRMSTAYVRQHSGAGASQPVIPCVLIGRTRRFRHEDLERFIQACVEEHQQRCA